MTVVMYQSQQHGRRGQTIDTRKPESGIVLTQHMGNFSLGKRIWWFPLAFSPCGIQGKLKVLLRFGFNVSLLFYFVYTIEVQPVLVWYPDGSSKFVRLFKNTWSKKFELPYLLVLLAFTLHFFCIPCSWTRGNIFSKMVCKSTYMNDRVKKIYA